MQTHTVPTTILSLTAKLTALSGIALALSACGAAVEGEHDAWQDPDLGQIGSPATLDGSSATTPQMSSPGTSLPAAKIDVELQFLCGATVTNNRDSGPGSLREIAANPPSFGSVCFSNAVFNAERPLADRTITVSSPILLNKSVHVAGPGIDALVVSGGNASSVFSVGGAKVTLYGFSVAHSRGSAINAAGNLTLERMRLQNNHATQSGGAIYNGGKLRIVRSTLTDNSAGWNGGAIYGYYGSELSIESSTFSNNTAAGSGGALCKIDGDVSIARSNFLNNQAASGGAIFHRSAKLLITRSSFESNVASQFGGALYQAEYGVTAIELHDSALLGNWAGSGGGGASNERGAHFYMFGSSEVAYNGAGRGAGGISGGVLHNVVAGGNVHSNAPRDL